MSQTYGQAMPGQHVQQTHVPAARYLVIIGAGGSTVARLYLEDRVQVAEFDAGTEEVTSMTQGLVPSQDGLTPAWDKALAGHSAAERAQAHIYTLAV